MSKEKSKAAAARRALDWVQDGMLVGLGTGSTSEEMVRLLGERRANVEVVTTSDHITQMAQSLGLTVRAGFPDFHEVDLTMDVADEVDPHGRLIKGGGGALLREKLVAAASHKLIIMVDEGKHVERLGSTRGVPVEIVPFGWSALRSRIEHLGAEVELRKKDGKPFVTDQGNWIFDCQFGPIDDPMRTHDHLKALCGVVETGIFLKLCSVLVTGSEDGSTRVAEFSRR